MFFRCGRPHGAKNFRFSKFIVCPHGQGVLSRCGHFANKGGSIIGDFVRTSFMDGPTAPYFHRSERAWQKKNMLKNNEDLFLGFKGSVIDIIIAKLMLKASRNSIITFRFEIDAQIFDFNYNYHKSLSKVLILTYRKILPSLNKLGLKIVLISVPFCLLAFLITPENQFSFSNIHKTIDKFVKFNS